MSYLAIAFVLSLLVAAAFVCGRLHAQWEVDQLRGDERPAGWAVELARKDPLKLINLLRQERLP